jgi:hypothetical protein
MEMLEPIRLNERNDNVLEREAQSRELKALAARKIPYMLRLDPKRHIDRRDIDVPMWTRSRTEREDPNFAAPQTDTELPRRRKLRTESELPRCVKSRTETNDPNCCVPKTEHPDDTRK